MLDQSLLAIKSLEFARKASFKHNNFYDYSKTVYINANNKLTITCSVHGDFSQIPRKHLSGQGCPKCAFAKTNNDRKLTLNEFLSRSKIKHGNRYDYSKSIFVNSTTKITIVCPIHGEFQQLPAAHFNGCGCKKCGIVKNNVGKLTYEQFVNLANIKHINLYDYTNVNFVNSTTKVNVTCRIHGDFEVTPRGHVLGRGCRLCGHKNAVRNYKLRPDQWETRIRTRYGDSFDFSSTDFSQNPIEFICPKHGKIVKDRACCMFGDGCAKCSHEKLSLENRMTFDEFINRSILLHGIQYDYSNVVYNNANTDIEITCRDHGTFYQSPKHHLRGQGCPKCKISSGQLSLFNFIKSIYTGQVECNDREVLEPFEVDILLPDIKFGIEYDGLYYHSFNDTESNKQKLRHSDKLDLARNRGIRLLQFWESDWLNRNEIIKSMISNRLGLSSKIHARKCKIVELNNPDYRKFLDSSHLQGYRSSDVKLGLVYGDEIVLSLGMSRHKVHQWEVMRLASAVNKVVVGGFSKLLSHFKAKYNPDQIMTFADRRYSDGKSYEKMGFNFCYFTKPNYFYVLGNNVYSRQKFQKHKLESQLEVFDVKLTEAQNMFNNGYRRIWDAGHLKLIWNKNA